LRHGTSGLHIQVRRKRSKRGDGQIHEIL
jgi:hypothetical protein